MLRSTTNMHRAFAALVLLGGTGAAGITHAGEVSVAAMGPGYTAHDAPLGEATELRIDLRGEVSARCRMASPPVLADRLDFNRSGDAEASFGLDCNSPFSLRVHSREGGFMAENVREGVARLIPYEVAVAIETDSGLRSLGWCDADQLTDLAAGTCDFGSAEGWSSGQATAIDRSGTLTLRWSDPAEAADPALGRYRDTIVVELAVRS